MKTASEKTTRTGQERFRQIFTYLYHSLNGGHDHRHGHSWFVFCLAGYISLIKFAQASPFELTFAPSTSETNGIVATYSMWIQATNAPDPNQWQWIGQCKVGQTNIVFDSTNLFSSNPAIDLTPGTVMNPVRVTATANDASDNQSPFAPPILFDTNAFVATPPPVITNAPPALVPPTILSIHKL